MDALQDLVVLDLTRVLAGPYCTMILADFGAKVIKIERPGSGDDTRGMGPFVNESSMYYANVNRNKKGITLNLKDRCGKELFLDMVKKADVVVENYRPGVMDKLGLGYDVLKEKNDRIIYAAVSGFGSYGRHSQKPGYDIIAQSFGGLMSITGEVGGQPLRVGNAMGDVLGGMNLVIGILLAVHARNLTGKGQRVDVALVDSVISSLETCTQRYFASQKEPDRMGNRYAAAYPYDAFCAKDGNFVIGCANDKLFNLLCKAINRVDLLDNHLYETNQNRCKNYKTLKEEIEKWSRIHTVAECCEIIANAGVPTSPINNLHNITEDLHIVNDREMFVPLRHPEIGEMKVNGNPIKLMDTMPKILHHAPLLGQDNVEIYKEMLGLSKEEIQTLTDKNIL